MAAGIRESQVCAGERVDGVPPCSSAHTPAYASAWCLPATIPFSATSSVRVATIAL